MTSQQDVPLFHSRSAPTRGRTVEQALLATALTASQTGSALDRVIAGLVNTANTNCYDRAVDGIYLSTHVGGSHLHHLLDGRHDLVGAILAARDACPQDTLGQAVWGAAHHLAKDSCSVMGLPVTSLDPGVYERSSGWIQQHLGIPLSWQADFMQINGTELLAGSLAAVAVVMGVRRRDAHSLMELAGGVGLGAMLAANPIAILAAAIALTAGLSRARGEDCLALAHRSAVGAAATGTAILTGNLLGGFAAVGYGPLALSLIISLAAGLLIRRVLLGNWRQHVAPTQSDGKVPDHSVWSSYILTTSRRVSTEYDTRAVTALHAALA